MPLVYQQNINATTKIAVWHISEPEDFFQSSVTVQREIKHWHKRLQHLAGRLLLKELYPEFPVSMIRIADTRKPFLEDDPFHFSISHCGDYAAAIVSRDHRVGADVESVSEKIGRLGHKFTSEEELSIFSKLEQNIQYAIFDIKLLTLCWSIKEAIFKWWGNGAVDFKNDIIIKSVSGNGTQGMASCTFKNKFELDVHFLSFSNNYLTWVLSEH